MRQHRKEQSRSSNSTGSFRRRKSSSSSSSSSSIAGSESRGRTTSGSSPVTGLGRYCTAATNQRRGITSRKILLPCFTACLINIFMCVLKTEFPLRLSSSSLLLSKSLSSRRLPLGMIRMCLAEPHWFRLSVATAEVVRDSRRSMARR
ncbi:uncharacterized protein EURHEDRAFT_310484 [Aspergillus ruber CBS 135680]|uniref:Uncharacterized protein n=1 Tax=Aspergillus ruber (strain CBS 135680) TaxID=1388766 RepID=A0A017S112_ASPRC|nr:uncharacterized protein EURHEDRAFT_310484 [Aspergillus ruber CBS 135680]EYE90319.1 hypothetical protein EURHEDRAFT_310484 [Aspergillus ruber CBS 135680]